MKKGKLLIIIGLVLVALAAGLYFGKPLLKPARAALQISSTPEARVFLNNEEKGRTPFYSTELQSGTYTLRLEPAEADSGLVGWEQEIELPANIMTSVDRQLATDLAASSGKIVSLEKTRDKNTSSIEVIVDPDQATVFVNGESKGFSPYAEDLAEEKYQLRIASSGYQEQSFEVMTVAGYRLRVMVKLAKQEMAGVVEGSESESGDDEEEVVEEETGSGESTQENKSQAGQEKPYVQILETPTGWLRVRSTPSTSGEEVAKVEPDETFPYLGEENGWYEIEYESDKSGWISSVYAKLFE